MSRFVLVHGAWHGGWCWRDVVTHLSAAGHEVSAPDLPLESRFEDFVDVVVAAVQSSAAPVILVGHSMAGAVISAVAERIPERIERLVFLTAFAPQNGQSINDLARRNVASALRDNVVPSGDGLVSVKPDVIPMAFYHDCSADDTAFAIARLRPMAPGAFGARLELSDNRYGKVPKQYIECIADQAIHIVLQREMAQAARCTFINSMQTGHSPFLAAPAALAALISTVGIKDARR